MSRIPAVTFVDRRLHESQEAGTTRMSSIVESRRVSVKLCDLAKHLSIVTNAYLAVFDAWAN